MVIKTYLESADNDEKIFAINYNNGLIANLWGSVATNICEKYMKDIIDKYCMPENTGEMLEKDSMLRTHNIHNLFNYIEDHTNYSFSRDTKMAMMSIKDFYSTTRYPGEDSYAVNQRDMDNCAIAVSLCRKETLTIEDSILSDLLTSATLSEDLRNKLEEEKESIPWTPEVEFDINAGLSL